MSGLLAGRRWRNSVRLRFTLLYGGVFLLAGALLIGVLYVVFVVNLPNVDREVLVRIRELDGTTRIEQDSGPPLLGLGLLPETDLGGDGGSEDGPGPDTARERLALQGMSNALEQVEAQRMAAVWNILRWSLLALLGVCGLALAFGWLMAGRVLRPVRSITATARRVADSSLHERINLPGPNDEFKELADTFDAMLDRLHQSFDGQRRFVANASHELRTPLAVNQTLLEVAMAHHELTPELRQTLLTLLSSNDRTKRLIDGLLTLARSEHQRIGSESVDLSDVAADALEQTAYEASRAGVRIDGQPNPAFTVGDRALLERLVLNLVQNAVRHNHPGGWADVRTGPSDQPERVELVVRNSGPVVQPSGVERLFDPFQRDRPDGEPGGASVPDRDGGQAAVSGAGLGLSIVRSIARTHGGEVRAEARPAGGLDVRVTLPAASGP